MWRISFRDTMLKIDSYDFGEIVINGEYIDSDVVILRDKVLKNWRRLEGHRLQLQDVRDYLLEDVDYVVIGTGYYGMLKVDPDVVYEFKKKGKEVVILKTSNAVEIYNELVEKGLKVVAFLHLTC